MLVRSDGFEQAASQTPAAAVLKACRALAPQKQASYTEAAADAAAGGTQPPLASYNGPHPVAHEGSEAKGMMVVTGNAVVLD